MSKRSKALCLVLVFLLAMLSVLAVGCGEKPGPEQPAAQPEVGVYYFDAGNDEYTLTLNAGNTFTLLVKGESLTGSYTLTDGTLSLDFNAEGKETISASLADNVITLTYEGASMRFLKKLSHTVHFETNGGSAVQDITVLNGKTVAKPADPAREGFLFVGWYADAEFKTPFAFDSQPITSNVTVYAQWSEATASGIEYNVSFDLNYENAAAPAAKQTVGGKLFDLPTVARDGYEFKGWWISMENDGAKLSYQYQDGMVFDAHTVLFALWQSAPAGSQLPAPIVTVGTGSVSWGAVDGARSYAVKVLNADGEAVIDTTTASTTVNVPFDTYEAGEYEIRVTALANSGDANNSEAVRFFTNKALRRVSLFVVVGSSTLVFNTVEHAEKYLITVVCGNSEHNHTAFDNGSSRTFNFANCEMTEDGIKFIVTAVAEGYASSTSQEFIYKRVLPSIGGLRFDEATQTVSWDEVAGAAQYMVSVNCGNAAHNHDFVSNGSKTSVSLKECAPREGGITVKVYPAAKGYASPAAVEYTFNKANLSTPEIMGIGNTLLAWTPVEGATEYEVKVNGTTHKATQNFLDLASIINGTEGSVYTVSVRAIGTSQSLWSDELVARYYEMDSKLTYANSTLTWAPVIGVESYEIQVNDGAIQTVVGYNFVEIELTKAGVNVIKVRFADGNSRSEWVQTEVYAHTVIFDTRGGSEIAVQYKAVGDKMELPAPEKMGYGFIDWYNVPGGPASNGMAYTDEMFAESGSVVLYAYYKANEYTLNYNYGEGGAASDTSATVRFDSNYKLTVPVADNAAGAFGGWFSAPYGMGVQYTDAKGNSLAPWDSLEGGEVYAFWIDHALRFSLTKVNGKDAYAVSAGERIGLVEEITIPATYKGLPVAMVSGNAFKDCTNLKVINLPNSLELISLIDPFTGCSSLEAVNVYVVEGNNSIRYWSESGVLFDNGSASATTNVNAKLLFMPQAKTGSYRIPTGIAEIPEGALANSAITKVIIPASVTTIGKNAFENCVNLTSVVFETAEGEKALSISAKAFAGCTNLQKIMLPARLSSIALTKYTNTNGVITTDDTDNAFTGCTSLVSINVAAKNANYKSVNGLLYSADGRTLYYCPATVQGVFEIPAGTQAIAPGAFIGCTEITELVIPNTVTNIGECAFYGLSSNLTKVTFRGNGLNDVTVGTYAFRSCLELSEIVFEPGSRVSVIGEGAFYDCESIVSFKIPATVTEIKDSAFRGCYVLESIEFEANGKTLAFGEDVFYNCSALKSITLPANVSAVPGVFSGCSSLVSVEVVPESTYFTSENGVLFNKDKTEILFFPQSNEGEDGVYTIPATVTKIANGVFRNAKSLDKVIIPATVIEIGDDAFRESRIDEIVFEGTPAEGTSLIVGDRAFYGAYVEELIFPAHTKSIGEYAFADSDVSSVTFNEGLESLGGYAFYDNTAIYGVEIVLPASLTELGEYAFASSSAQYITMNEGLVKIGDYAFYDTYYLMTVSIPSTVTEIGAFAFADSNLGTSFTFEGTSSLQKIGAHAFDGSYLVEIVIPKSVTDIGAYAFYYNSYLESVTFENAADGETVGDLILGTYYTYTYDSWGSIVTARERGHVFDSCNYLETVTLSKHVVEICEGSFYKAGGYSSNATFTIPADGKLAVIGAEAFRDSGIAGDIVLPNTLNNLDPVVSGNNTYDRMAIGAYAFEGTEIETVTFAGGGKGTVTIGAYAFADCGDLTEVTLPANLGDYTNYNGDVIEALEGGALVFAGESSWYLSDSVENIFVEDVEGEGKAPYVDVEGVVYKTDGTNLTELVVCPIAKAGTVAVPATVTEIRDYAFYFCESLEAITFTEGTADMTIGKQAFFGCSSLTELTLPANVVSVGEQAFVECSDLETLTLSKKLTAFDGTMVTDCDSLKAVNVGTDGKGDVFSSIEGVLFNAAATELVLYPGAREGETYTVPAGVTVIGVNAFKNNSELSEVVLPAGLKEIDDSAFYSAYISEIIIPNTVERIGVNAFSNASYLETIDFEDDGTASLVLSDGAFRYTYYLESIAFPARLTAIGDSAFYKSAIESMSFGENSALSFIGDAAFSSSSLVEVELPKGVATIGNEVFAFCDNLISASFDEGLTAIGDSTFAGSTAIESVSFPASLRTMGKNTFFYYAYDVEACGNLRNVTFAAGSQLEAISAGTFAYTALEQFEIPASVQRIEGIDLTANRDENPGAFEGCAALEMVSFVEGSKCMIVGDYAFYDCSALKFFTIPTSVGTLGQSAFESCDALTTITIPETVSNLGERLFASCSALSNVTLDTKATVLPGYMFASCSNLSNIDIPETVVKIGSACFSQTSFEKLTIPANVTDLSGYGIFSNIETLESVEILGNVTELGRQLFSGCSSLSEVILPDSLRSIGEETFAECVSLQRILLPVSLSEMDATAFSDSALAEYEVAEGNTTFAAREGVLFSADLTKILSYPANKTDTSFTIPKEVTLIGDSTFAGITSLRFVNFEPDGAEALEIGESAFEGCTGLTNLVLPDRLTKIGRYAFYNCINLYAINVPANVKLIDEYAFYSCSKLLEVYNESQLNITLDDYYGNGRITSNAVNVYTPTEGASLITVDENGFVTLSYYDDRYETTTIYLVGYIGEDKAELVVPTGIDSIYDFALMALPNLETLTISEGVAVLEENSLYELKAMTVLNLPQSLEEISGRAVKNCTALGEVIIPATVESTGSSIFDGCSNVVFLMEAAEKPSGWSSSWNHGRPATWGFDGQLHTYTFNTNCDITIDSIESDRAIELPVLDVEGQYFGGWYDNAEFAGSPVASPYYSASKTELFAKWMTQEEFDSQFAGTSFEFALDMAVGTDYAVKLDSDVTEFYFKYTAEKSMAYYFSSYNEEYEYMDTYGHLYDADGNELKYNDDGGRYGYHTGIRYELEAGQTYYFMVRMRSTGSSGDFTVSVAED